MDEAIAARYDWNAEAVYEAFEVHRKQASGLVGRWVLRALLIVFAVVSIGLPLAIVLFPGNGGPHCGLLVGLIGFFVYLWGTIYLALWSKGIKRRAARKMIGELRPEAQPVEWMFTEVQLANRTALSASTFLWSLFIKAVEAPTGFLLYQNVNFFHWIPGYGFGSASELRRFADLARSKVANYMVLGECQFPAKPKPIGLDEL